MRALSLMAVVLCASVALPLRAAELAAAGVPMAAVWKQRKVEFHYFGRTSRYSCDGLRDKMRAMLLEMGARQDLRVPVPPKYLQPDPRSLQYRPTAATGRR